MVRDFEMDSTGAVLRQAGGTMPPWTSIMPWVSMNCARLVRPGGHLVMHETVAWFDGARANLEAAGFEVVGQHMMPADFCWTDYGAPLETRIQAFRAARGGRLSWPSTPPRWPASNAIRMPPPAGSTWRARWAEAIQVRVRVSWHTAKRAPGCSWRLRVSRRTSAGGNTACAGFSGRLS